MRAAIPVGLALALLVALVGQDDRVMLAITCDCSYARWACEAFWWVLC